MIPRPVASSPQQSLVPPQPGSSATSRILGLAVFLALLCFAAHQVSSADFWWHLRAGELMVSTGAVPHTDPFSYTAQGKPWVAHEYLSEVLIYLLYRLGGFALLVPVFAGIIAAAFWLAWRRSEGPWLWRAAAVLLGAWAAVPAFAIRPQAITLLLFAAFLLVLDRYRQSSNWRWLFVLPLLTLVWVQVHAAFVAGLAVIVLSGVAALLDAAVGELSWRRWRRMALELGAALLGCLAVIPLNPNGLRMYTYPLEAMSTAAFRAHILEWKALDPTLAMYWPFAALVLLTVGAMLASRKRYLPGEMFMLVLFTCAALYSRRHLGLAVLVAVPLLARYLPRPRSRVERQVPRAVAVVLLVVAVVAAGVVVRGQVQRQQYAAREVFPRKAVDYVVQHHLPGKIFNSYEFGGYLIWRLYPDPQYRVFIDGRADVYGGDFLNHYADIADAQIDARAEFDRLGIRTAIVRPRSGISGILHLLPNIWKLVYLDSSAAVYTR
jgi:hypothetical protein